MSDYATNPEAYRNPQEVHPVTLSPEDAAAVDLLLEHGAPLAEADPRDDRAKRAAAWLETLGAHRVSQPPIDLAARTLAAVAADARAERMRVSPAAASAAGARPAAHAKAGHAFPRRLAEYAAMAIAATVLVAVLIPGIGNARDTAKRVACANNLRTVGGAFASFAGDHGNALPMLAMPAPAAVSWKPVAPALASPTEHSNTANMLPLLREKYLAEPARLACPAVAAAVPADWSPEQNDLPDALHGYNYTNMYGPDRPNWDHKTTTIILADRNPLFVTPRAEDIHENSPNHAGRGSMVLYADASARWQTTPDVGPKGDNIWTITTKPIPAAYTFREVPASADDVFLAP